MTSSSDSDLELEQRSQPKLTSDPAAEAQETSPHKPKTPWELMRSKSNKAFSKNYLQDMIGGSPKLETLPSDSCAKPHAPSKLFGKHGRDPIPDDDDDSDSDDELEIDEISPADEVVPSGSRTTTETPTKGKKVFFNDMVRKRDIEVLTPEESSSTEDDDTDDAMSKETHKDSNVKLTGSGRTRTENEDQHEMQDSEGSSSSHEEQNTKKTSNPHHNRSPNKQKSKFTIAMQGEVSKNSFSSTSNSGLGVTVGKNVKNSLLPKIHSKNGVISNKKSKDSSSSSKNEQPSEKIDTTTNLKDIKKKSKLQLKVSNRSNISSSESSDTEDGSKSGKNKNTPKSKAINKINSKSKIIISPSKKAVNKASASSSSEDSEGQEKNTSKNTSLTKTNKRYSNSPKEFKKTNKAQETSSDSDSSTENIKNSVNKSRLSDSESSGKEFDNSKSSNNITIKKTSFSKNPKYINDNSKYDTTGGDTDTPSPSKKRNEFLHKKLETYSTLNNFEKVTSTTYNLSKDLRNDNNEIYIAQIPKGVHPKSLVDNLVFFDKPTVLNIENKTYTLNVNFDKNVSHIVIADSSGADDNHFNVTSIKPTGILSFSKENKVKKKSIKMHKEPIEEVIEEPKNLKEQHLLLGQDYEDRVKLDKWISDKLDGLIMSFNKKRKHKKLKKKSLEKSAKSPDENLDIFKLLDEHTEKKLALDETDGSYVNTKKKKKSRSEKHEDKTTEKSEMEESIDIINQLMLEIEPSREEKKSKKHKKESHERSKSVFEEDTQPVQEESISEKRKRSKSVSIELTVNSFKDGSHSPLSNSQKKKKSRAALEDVEDGLHTVVSPKKQKKRGIVNSTMLSPAVEGTSIFDHEESGIPKLDDNLSIDSFIDDLVKGVHSVKEAKKKRKRKDSNGEETKLYEKKKRKPD